MRLRFRPRNSGIQRRGRELGVLFFGALLATSRYVAARENLPVAPPPKPFALTPPALRVLSNGLRVVVVERHSLPLVTLRLEIKAGAESDPKGQPGTAQFVAALLDEGTSRRSAREIAEEIDQVGGAIQTGAGWDRSFAEATVLADHLELASDILSDIVIHPRFSPQEVERARKQTLSALDVLRGDPSYLADSAFRRVVFGSTSYGHPEEGNRKSVEVLTAEGLRAFHARAYRPDNSILALVGDVTPRAAFEAAEKYFGEWRAARSGDDQPATDLPLTTPEPSRRIVVIDKPDSVQTEIRIGSLGIPRGSSNFYALNLANQILGGPAANHLFRALRSREGLTYGASSELLCYRRLGGWVAKTSVRTPETIHGVEVALEQMKRLRGHATDREELVTAKGYLVGHLALEFETAEGIANQVLALMLYDLPLDYWSRYPERVQSMSTDEVSVATRRYFDPDRAVIVLVGDASAFKKDLKKLGPARVIPATKVDFESEDFGGIGGNESKP